MVKVVASAKPTAAKQPRGEYAFGMLGGSRLAAALIAASLVSCTGPTTALDDIERHWLAGDHHIHSRYSVTWDREADPPAAIIGGHGIYPIPLNALMAKWHGLVWMVATDHGGRAHSKLNLEQAYPNLVVARDAVPEVIQFYGIELNAPAADHVSVIMPHTPDEAARIYELESRFDRSFAGFAAPRTSDPDRNSEQRMIEALRFMRALPDQPLVIANHPSRTAAEGAQYGLTTPAELRAWNDAAPEVAVGMIGAPGHQAISINPDGTLKPTGRRGQYRNQPTLGGFDPMTARLGGVWDSMLGEGRRWWITANSDSHEHWTDGGVDFWPGEYSKTYVYADKTHADILASLRAGYVFVTTGDLVSELDVSAESAGRTASIGGQLHVASGADLRVTIRARDPAGPNSHGDQPTVNRIDLILGQINGPLMNAAKDSNPTTKVVRRFDAGDWTRDGEILAMSHTLEGIDAPVYLRVRGTSTAELEPAPDPSGEDPWADLWFYSNPIFVLTE